MCSPASVIRESALTDIDFFLDNLDKKLFPGVSSAVQVHNGFGEAHADTAQTILAETKRLIATKGATQVMLVSTYPLLSFPFAELDLLT